MRRVVGASRCHNGVTTTRRDLEARPAPDLVDRDFTATAPNQLWVADITFVLTANGFLYLAVVLDAWNRKIVGWAMATHLRAELVVDALKMVIGQRRPGDVIHHSDQGSQYTSLAFGKRCKEAGVRPLMGSVGDPCHDAMCESFFAALECELLDRRRFASQPEARMARFSFIEGWYNPVRLHSALGYRSPRWPTKLHSKTQSQNRNHPSPSILHESGAASVGVMISKRVPTFDLAGVVLASEALAAIPVTDDRINLPKAELDRLAAMLRGGRRHDGVEPLDHRRGFPSRLNGVLGPHTFLQLVLPDDTPERLWDDLADPPHAGLRTLI